MKQIKQHFRPHAASGHLIWALLLAVLWLGGLGGTRAQESVEASESAAPTVFVVPKAYPIERYEAGWNKNPFTLKTAPTVLAQDSFAKDLSIAAYYGETQDPTVVVVNTKTGERIKLKKSQAAANGMQLKSVTLGGTHKDMVVEVTLGSETSEVRFNDDYMKQMATTAESARATAVPGRPPGAPGQHPSAQPPGILPKLPQAGTPAATSQMSPPRGIQNRGVPNAGIAGRPMAAPTSAPMTAASQTNVNVNPAAGTSGVPNAPRRRLIAPATAAPVPQ